MNRQEEQTALSRAIQREEEQRAKYIKNFQKEHMNVEQVKKDFDNGVIISRSTWAKLIEYAMKLQAESNKDKK